MILWHYTTGENFRLIVRDGVIEPATTGVPKGEKPAVWFSTNQIWERTAAKGIIVNGVRRTAGIVEMIGLTGGLYRIGVLEHAAPHQWKEFCKLSNISTKAANRLKRSAAAVGASHFDWRCSFEPVSRESWQSVQRLEDPSTMTWAPAQLGQRLEHCQTG